MQYLIILYIFIFGLIIGSFLNCLIWRLHKSESMLNRSYCPKCKKQIAWYDNIPVLSFAILGGKCRNCKKSISFQYPLVELITGILFVISFFINYGLDNFGVLILRDWFIISIMIIVFIYDLRWYLILDIVVLPACIFVFILNLLLGANLFWMLICGIIGMSFFLVQFLISQGKWIGGGDIRLGFFIGLIFYKIDYLILALLLGYFIGSIVGIFLIIIGKKKFGSKLPLGVFLSTSTIITLFFGDKILNWYFRFF